MKMSASDFVGKKGNNFTQKIAISVLAIVHKEHIYQSQEQLVLDHAPLESISQEIVHDARKIA